MLINQIDNTFIFYGKTLYLDLSYDVVLRVYKLFKDDIFSDAEKIDIALSMFVINYRQLKKCSYEKKANIIKTIFDEFITKKNNTCKETNKKTFDFYQDADYIYASFFQAYGIDLIEQQGKLPWQKFIALFQGLPADTKICEVMSIRVRDIPEQTKYNTKEIQALKQAKKTYALKTDDESEETFQADINRFGAILMQSAIKKEG